MKNKLILLFCIIWTANSYGQSSANKQLDYIHLTNCLNEYKSSVLESYQHTYSLVFDKASLYGTTKFYIENFQNAKITELNSTLGRYHYLLDKTDIVYLDSIEYHTIRLIEKQKYIVTSLNKLELYDDPFLMFDVTGILFDNGGVKISSYSIIYYLDKLLVKKTSELKGLIRRDEIIILKLSIEANKSKKVKD